MRRISVGRVAMAVVSAMLLFTVMAVVRVPVASAQGATADSPKKDVIENAGVQIDLKAFKVVVGKDGKESFAPADEAKPAEVLEYRAVYFNPGKTAISNLAAKIPIPTGTEYLPDTARPASAHASLDGVKYAPIPLMRKVKRPDGSEVEEKVPYREYRSLLWEIKEVKGEGAATASLRVRLIPLEGQAVDRGTAAAVGAVKK